MDGTVVYTLRHELSGNQGHNVCVKMFESLIKFTGYVTNVIKLFFNIIVSEFSAFL